MAIGIQDFEQLIQNHYFNVDKKKFIKEWWESGNAVTLLSLSFANVKEFDYVETRQSMNGILENIYNKNIFLLDDELLTENEKTYFRSVTSDMEETAAIMENHLCNIQRGQ